MADNYNNGEQATKILMITAGIVFLGGILFLIILRLYALHCRRYDAEIFFGDTNPAEMGDRGTYLRRLFVGMFVDVPRDVPDLHRAGQSTPTPEEEKSSFGLAASVVENLPTFIFKRGSERLDLRDSVECPVCLNEFAEGEKGRSLPQCGHCFHAECVDMWFFSHTTCPLCRSEVKSYVEALSEICLATESSQSTTTENSAENSAQFSARIADGMGPSQSHASGKMPSSRGGSRAGSRPSSRPSSRPPSQPFVDLELGENSRDPQIRETAAGKRPREDGRSEAHSPSNVTGPSHNNSSERVEDGSDNHL